MLEHLLSTDLLPRARTQSVAVSATRALMLVIGILMLLYAVAAVVIGNGGDAPMLLSQELTSAPVTQVADHLPISQPISLLLLGCGLLSTAIAIRRMP